MVGRIQDGVIMNQNSNCPEAISTAVAAERDRWYLALLRRADRYERNGGSDYRNAAYELRCAAQELYGRRDGQP